MVAERSASRIEVVRHLERGELEAVTWLVEAATEADGVRPLSEHVSLHLRRGGDPSGRNLLVWAPDGTLAAYGHLDVTDVVEGASAEVVVAPGLRRRGYGRALVDAVLAETADGRLRLWAHGAHPAAGSLARSLGFERIRELWQMRRSLNAHLPEPVLPEGVRLRTFVPGADDDAWLALNARAFEDHPEQGRWSAADLHRRESEPWFDPAGFFLAERGDALLGFHWTKVHGGRGRSGTEDHGHDPIGEVYVVGVDPGVQGLGLGRLLTLVGLRHLQRRGLPVAMLYVEADNAAAIRVYAALGFQRWDVDVMFQRAYPPPGAAAVGE